MQPRPADRQTPRTEELSYKAPLSMPMLLDCKSHTTMHTHHYAYTQKERNGAAVHAISRHALNNNNYYYYFFATGVQCSDSTQQASRHTCNSRTLLSPSQVVFCTYEAYKVGRPDKAE